MGQAEHRNAEFSLLFCWHRRRRVAADEHTIWPTRSQRGIRCGRCNVVSGVAPWTLPSEGSCKEFWALDGQEVHVVAGTMGTSRLLHGAAGDLQLRLSEGGTVWCGEHHVALMHDTDALAVGGERADATANNASNTAAEVLDASRLEQANVNTPIVRDDELSDASHSSRDSSEGARARADGRTQPTHLRVIISERPRRLQVQELAIIGF